MPMALARHAGLPLGLDQTRSPRLCAKPSNYPGHPRKPRQTRFAKKKGHDQRIDTELGLKTVLCRAPSGILIRGVLENFGNDVGEAKKPDARFKLKDFETR